MATKLETLSPADTLRAYHLWLMKNNTKTISEKLRVKEAAVYNSLNRYRDERRRKGPDDGTSYRARLEEAEKHKPLQRELYTAYSKVDDKPEGWGGE